MSPEQLEELKKLIKETIREEVKAEIQNRFKIVLEKLDNVSEDVNNGFNNVDEDRKDFAEVKTSQATVERLMRELLDIISNQTSRLTKTVEHKADQAIEASAQAVADKVEPTIARVANKIIKGVELNVRKKKFWQFWKK